MLTKGLLNDQKRWKGDFKQFAVLMSPNVGLEALGSRNFLVQPSVGSGLWHKTCTHPPRIPDPNPPTKVEERGLTFPNRLLNGSSLCLWLYTLTQADLLYFNPTSRPSPRPRPFPAPLIEAVVDLDFHLKGQTMAGHNITFFIILSFEGRVRAFFFFTGHGPFGPYYWLNLKRG